MSIVKKQSIISRKASKTKLPLPTEEKPELIPQRVFLYLKTLKIENLPALVDDHAIVLRLKHGNNAITKIEDHYTDKTDANISSESSQMPTYSIRINQDNIDDLNFVCDTPLMITLYEHVPSGHIIRKSNFSFDSIDSSKVSETKLGTEPGDQELPIATEDVLFPLAQGSLDLLQFFSKSKSSALNSIFLYPITISKMPIATPTCKLTMQVTSVLPLLKNFSFCNTVFITFESIYNAKPEIINGESTKDLLVDLSFQSQTTATEKVKLCSFSMFSKDIISGQNAKHKWENMKDANINATSLGVYSGLGLNLHKLFVGLLGTNGVNFKFDEILQDEEYALVCNSLHRYALTKELSVILENAIAFNEQHILMEMYRENEPNNILLEGTCDLSVFLYPKVNACRFAVELKPPNKRRSKSQQIDMERRTSMNKENTNNSRLSNPISLKNGKGRASIRRQSAQPQKTTFAILSICLLKPITEVPESISKFNENSGKNEALKTCNPVKSETKIALQLEKKKGELYKELDDIVHKSIEYIIKNNIKYPLDAKDYLCCQLGNMVNKIMKLIASDFNIRVPTKTNIEFVNLITTVYKELEQRWYDIVQSCDVNTLEQCFVHSAENRWKIIKAMEMAKLTFEAGKEELGSFILDKIKIKNPKNAELNFYIFIYDMEKLDYEAAKKYLHKPIKEQLAGSEYHTEIMKIYIEHLEKLQQEETAEKAFEELLNTLKEFIEKYPKEIDCWILLYCLYANSRYLPGMEFTRWKYENLYKVSRKQLPPLPKSRWSINNNYKLKVTSLKGIRFYEVIETFLNLGLYQFAETIFNEISTECADLERYFMRTTFGIFQNILSGKYISRQVSKEHVKNKDNTHAYHELINGNLEYYRGNIVTAMNSYEKLLEIELQPIYEDFQAGLLRLGFYMLETEEKYETAQKAFQKCRSNGFSCMLADFGFGKAMYKLGRLEDALVNFSRATTYSMHIPDVWGYLALVNLKKNENFKALECWKYAKLDNRNIISDDIIEELNAINPRDCTLYVDVPEEPL